MLLRSSHIALVLARDLLDQRERVHVVIVLVRLHAVDEVRGRLRRLVEQQHRALHPRHHVRRPVRERNRAVERRGGGVRPDLAVLRVRQPPRPRSHADVSAASTHANPSDKSRKELARSYQTVRNGDVVEPSDRERGGG